tara:strand:+ start:891 stop:1082 length:192 start_codon:yes stop_codon:yes gene_type:complete
MIDDVVVEKRVPEDRKYVILEFPYSQNFIGKKDCYLLVGNSDIGNSAYAVPVSVYEKYLNKES